MSQIITTRRGNRDNSLIITIPKPIANLMNIKIGAQLELSQINNDRLEIRVIR